MYRSKRPPQITDALAGTVLQIRNVTIEGKRTSVRLEPMMWDALDEICRIEGLNRHQVCTLIKERHNPESSLTSAIRVFILTYFWRLADQSEDGSNRGRLQELTKTDLKRLLGTRAAPEATASESIAPDPAAIVPTRTG